MSRLPTRLPHEELAQTTAHGGLYLRRLIRSQLMLSVLTLIAFGGLVGSLPLALYLVPSLHDVRPLGVPLPLWLITVPPFPLLVAIGWLFTRRATALEDSFRELVEPPS